MMMLQIHYQMGRAFRAKFKVHIPQTLSKQRRCIICNKKTTSYCGRCGVVEDAEGEPVYFPICITESKKIYRNKVTCMDLAHPESETAIICQAVSGSREKILSVRKRTSSIANLAKAAEQKAAKVQRLDFSDENIDPLEPVEIVLPSVDL